MVTKIFDIYSYYEKALESKLEARELIAYALGLDRRKYTEWINDFISDDKFKDIKHLMERRLNGEPLAYILGEWEFYSLPFKVTKDVLIPRADTETLVLNALEFLEGRDEPKVLDLCSGSGCIGITIAKYKENSKVLACDISDEAILISAHNAKLNNVYKRYTVKKFDVLNPLKDLGLFDLIVSNPPYIKSRDILYLDKDVKDFEPLLALDGGEDGYIFYESILKNMLKNLKQKGKIMFEYGIGQEDVIKKLMEDSGLVNIKIKKDLCNINRIIEGTKI